MRGACVLFVRTSRRYSIRAPEVTPGRRQAHRPRAPRRNQKSWKQSTRLLPPSHFSIDEDSGEQDRRVASRVYRRAGATSRSHYCRRTGEQTKVTLWEGPLTAAFFAVPAASLFRRNRATVMRVVVVGGVARARGYALCIPRVGTSMIFNDTSTTLEASYGTK